MQFYLLVKKPNGLSQAARVDVLYDVKAPRGHALLCPTCGSYVSLLQDLPPYPVELELWGLRFGDVMTYESHTVLVSQKFREVYEAAGLSGLSKFEPVKVIRVIRRRRNAALQIPQYLRAEVALGETMVNQEASEFEWVEPPNCTKCMRGHNLKRWSRIVIDELSWDGADIFRPRGMANDFFVTERFKQVCEQNSIANAVFLPAECYSHDFYPWEHATRPERCHAPLEPGSIRILGVHPLRTREPCHLIEVEFLGYPPDFDWGDFTQTAHGLSRANWQVAYRETPVDDEFRRWCFFMHYLDFSRSLLTPAGPLELPHPTPRPAHLKDIKYRKPE